MNDERETPSAHMSVLGEITEERSDVSVSTKRSSLDCRGVCADSVDKGKTMTVWNTNGILRGLR